MPLEDSVHDPALVGEDLVDELALAGEEPFDQVVAAGEGNWTDTWRAAASSRPSPCLTRLPNATAGHPEGGRGPSGRVGGSGAWYPGAGEGRGSSQRS
ncbi:MAG: hypothetical protein L0I76_28940 [Pseudonocardia sp.]|nr:hypothetical protein [Pseudonocardia sp.]